MHWKTTLLIPLVHAQDVIYRGVGFGTYYYNVDPAQVCDTDFSAQNEGYLTCGWYSALSLNQIHSAHVVAMNVTQLENDRSLYCGKRVLVTVNEVQSDLQLFIGDGCERCGNGSSASTSWNEYGAPGLDFSYSALNELSPNACSAGHVRISWEIIDETLYDFSTEFSDSSRRPPGTTSVDEDDQGNNYLEAVSPSSSLSYILATTTTNSALQTSSDTTRECLGVWQCNGTVLEECLSTGWAPRATCMNGLTCKGGNEPYCG